MNIIITLDLPELTTISLHDSSFLGDYGDDRKLISVAPYNYKNTLIMKSMID